MVPDVRFLIGLRGCAVGLPERRGTTSAMAFLEGDEDPTEDLVLGRVGAIFCVCVCIWAVVYLVTIIKKCGMSGVAIVYPRRVGLEVELREVNKVCGSQD